MLDGATARVSLKGALAGVRVLVVDDDEDVRDVLRLTLEHLGAEVRTAASANEALAAIDSALPDVLLSDLAMPDEDGCSLIRQVRSREKDRGGTLPAAAVTAHSCEDEFDRAKDAGFNLCLRKPLDVRGVAQIVEQLLAQPSR